MTSSKKQPGARALVAALALAGLASVGGPAQAAATIVINNLNAAGAGFNDPTPAAPVGGNTGTTLGAQRLIAFTYAANIWGATLTSSVPIVINAQMTPLSCTSTSATLGSAGATQTARNFTNAPRTGTLYPVALANKLSGTELGGAGAAQISANFNSNLGNPGCLDGISFYLGLDSNHGTNTDFVTVLLHEMGHGLGFQTFTNGISGAFSGGFPSVWDFYLTGTVTGKTWATMTAAERAASAISVNGLAWAGPLVTAAVPSVLRLGNPALNITGPEAGATVGNFAVGEASYGPVVSATPVTGQIMPAVNADRTLSLACDPLTGTNATAVKGNVALISRGTCNFAIKSKNVQNAGAIAVLIADNAPGAPAGLSGSDPTITIPTVRIAQSTGVALLAQLQRRSRTSSGVIGTLQLYGTQYSGANAAGQILMYAPNPFISGSSVSHYDTTAFRNQLMEPNINDDLTQSVLPPQDLTFRLLQDVGW